LDDLHSAESKGRWWLVGAAWHGDPLVDNHQAKQRKATSQPPLNESKDSVLLQLAKKHGMNTDIRRSIFIILMSSDVIPTQILASSTYSALRIISTLVIGFHN
jgi:nucleolar MIF4G domain-containing protein 1